MNKPSRVIFQRFEQPIAQAPPESAESNVVRRVLLSVVVILVAAVVLAAEWRLPPELRIGFFEATYTSP
jgi:hypothetical protein